MFDSKETKSFYIKKRGVTINLPTGKFDYKANVRSFVPNLIHSLDASNIYLLIKYFIDNNLSPNIYNIHDCFATTPDSMKLINDRIKQVFIQMYFDMKFILKMHKSFKEQVNSITNIYTEEEYDSETGIVEKRDYIISEKNNKKLYIPKKPIFIDNKIVEDKFVKGITDSLYFIN